MFSFGPSCEYTNSEQSLQTILKLPTIEQHGVGNYYSLQDTHQS